ncbi:hypothetical protein Goklo_007056 [Gossypium klotzschianum]|uniref:Uncharacterized protein n=1 Tax=Gossypium klotzschianum TaxID=34286 RepID=A0A7J8VJK7_9ROSI|nr:hypothetical protein [Gossypium klotzschianum]
MSPNLFIQQKEITLFRKMGVSIRPEAMAWPWICLSWSMDLLDSIRENGGSR